MARAAEEDGRKLLYTTDMQLVPFIWSNPQATAAQLRSRLNAHDPGQKPSLAGKEDLRGFEWHYYQHLLEHSAAVFGGRGVSVVDAAFSSNGQLVTLDQKGQVRRFDLSSQDEDKASRRDLPGGPPSAQSRALSPNGRLAALADATSLHVFNTSTDKETFPIDFAKSADRRVNEDRHVIFSRDEDRLVIVDSKIRWVSAVSGEVIASVDRQFNSPSSLALSVDGLTLAVVGYGNESQLFSIFHLDTATRTVMPGKTDVGGSLGACALSPDGQRIAFGHKLDAILTVFDTATGRLIVQHLGAHSAPISALAFSGDGAKLATADTQGTIKIWADAGKLTPKSVALLTLKGHTGEISTIGFSSDGKRLVTGGADKTVRVWDLDNAGVAIRPLEGRLSSPLSNCYVARFSPDGQLIAAASGSRLRLWDGATGQLVRELSAGDTSRIYSVAFSPADARLLAVGYGPDHFDEQAKASHVALWDIDAGTELARLPGATDLPNFDVDFKARGPVGALAFSPDGKYLVAGFGSKFYCDPESYHNPLKVWEVASRRLLGRLNGHTGMCISLDFSRDGTLLASGSRDGTALIWSTATWNRTRTLENPDKATAEFSPAERGMVNDVAFSPDGKTLAMASYGGNVHLWDVASGKRLETLKGHSSAVKAVAFSPDGRTLASGSPDHTVRLWNVETQRELMQLDRGSVELVQVHTLAFSPDGRHLLAGGEGFATTALWSAEPVVWNRPDRAAEKLRLLLNSNADFQSRIRMLSEHLRLYEALAKLDAKDVRVQAALAATRANWHASQRRWAEAALAFDHLAAADPLQPEAWLRTPGLLRLATALVRMNRPLVAATLLQAGGKHRTQDPASSWVTGVDVQLVSRRYFLSDATAKLFIALLEAVEKRLALDSRDAGLLELRAVLAGQEQEVDLATMLATAYEGAGRTREAVPYLVRVSAANPQDMNLCMKVAALQVWFGQDKEFANTCTRALQYAQKTSIAMTAEHTARVCGLLPTQDKAQQEAALVLARKSVEIAKEIRVLPFYQIALGIAEYRSGHFAEADTVLTTAMNGGIPIVTTTSAYFRAMSLFRQGKPDEARKLATEAAQQMEPLPKDEKNPLAGNAGAMHLMMWLAYKEARGMIQFDAAPPPKVKNDQK